MNAADDNRVILAAGVGWQVTDVENDEGCCHPVIAFAIDPTDAIPPTAITPAGYQIGELHHRTPLCSEDWGTLKRTSCETLRIALQSGS